MNISPDLTKRLVAEAIAVLLVVASIIGAGIMAQRLEGTGPAMTLLVNSLVCGAMLVVVIVVFAPVSGGHLNPAWTLLMMIKREMPAREGGLYIVSQIVGACAGAIVANVMFGQDPVSISSTARTGAPMWLSEFVASFGLIGAVLGAVRYAPVATPAVVGIYIVAAYWFTGSSSFASPAATIGRTLSDSYAGISPGSVPAYIVAQLLGALAAFAVFSWMFGREGAPEHRQPGPLAPDLAVPGPLKRV
jgi:glycerol uptake facilitator-like aquaporin